MNYVVYVLLTLSTFALMEFIAWATHKYVMHGFMWKLHRDHHEPHRHFFEENDWFSVIFAIPCIILFWLGSAYSLGWLTAIAVGILLYGIAYFFVHDIIVHQRVKILTRSRNRYIRAIRWAHKMHHKHLGPDNGESFGFLWVGKKYWEKINRDDAARTKSSTE